MVKAGPEYNFSSLVASLSLLGSALIFPLLAAAAATSSSPSSLSFEGPCL
jgi:hypothetical protein